MYTTMNSRLRNMKTKSLCTSLLAAMLLAAVATGTHAAPFGAAFTYQGKLATAAGPANGLHEFEFGLWDRESGGMLMGTVVIPTHPVSNGVFTVMLDYGVNAFADGGARWLEIHVKDSNSTNKPVQLTPRAPLTPAPFALIAGGVLDGSITGAKLADGAVTASKLAPNSVGGTNIADGSITTAKLADGSVSSTRLANGAVNSQHIAAGAIGSLQIAPNSVSSGKIVDGSIIGADIAPGVINSNHLAAGAVGSTQLAAGSVGSTQLAADAVTASHIAEGAIGSEQLAKPYQSGAISFTGQTTTFYPLVVTQAFAPAFDVMPIITLSPEASPGSEDLFFTAQVTSRSASGFAGRVGAPPRVQPLEHGANEAGSISLITVNPTPFATVPAFATVRVDWPYQELPRPVGLEFWRGTSDGENWSGVTITTNMSWSCAAAHVNGRPAVAFQQYTNSGIVRPAFVRANDNLGSTWGAPVIVDTASTNCDVVKLQIVNGRPAMLYDSGLPGQRRLWFARATDANGTSWGAPAPVSPAMDHVKPFRFFTVNGKPAIMYQETPAGRVAFIAAFDTNGTIWLPPVTVAQMASVHDLSPAIVNGRPAVTCVGLQSTSFSYIRALDAAGTQWAAPVSVAPHTPGYGTHDSLLLGEVNGRPSLFFNYRSPYYTEALDADGTDWRSPVQLAARGGGAFGGFGGFLKIGGGIATVFSSVDTIDYIWSGPPPARVHWTAVSP